MKTQILVKFWKQKIFHINVSQRDMQHFRGWEITLLQIVEAQTKLKPLITKLHFSQRTSKNENFFIRGRSINIVCFYACKVKENLKSNMDAYFLIILVFINNLSIVIRRTLCLVLMALSELK